MKYFSKKGLTLTELLISTILIGIVMMGVASVSISIKGLQESTSKATLMNMRIMAAMRYITKDAAYTIGDESNRGVWEDKDGADQAICFRYDAVVPPTPEDYTDDRWTCYILNTSDNILYRCENLATATDTCQGTPTELLTLTQSNFFNIIDDVNARLDYIEINLNTRYNTSLVTHPVTNPDYSVSTTINPVSHGR